MGRIPALHVQNALATCTNASSDPGPVTQARQQQGSLRPACAIRALMAAGVLLACLNGAAAQVLRNGDEYGGNDHQPTKAEVIRREDRAGTELPPAANRQDNRSVEQLGQQLLHEGANNQPHGRARPDAR